MTHRKRPLLFLLLAIIFFVLGLSMVLFTAPTMQIMQSPVPITMQLLFFPVLFLFLFFAGTYVFNNKIHGLLLGLFAVSYLLFRLTNLTHPFFFLLLATLFIALGFLFNYRK